ncbi:MAG: DUF3750 domain-containing protein [Rickettsiales bacterium]|nr:DUF3750 domain-containing protein [Rickettsiales bacterium]
MGPLWMLFSGRVDLKADYRTANRESAHLAPLPHEAPEAVIQVYAARAFNWRGIFASHCWFAVKAKGASEYTVYQIVGWRNYRGLPALSIAKDVPDRNWYNQTPKVILDVRGEKAEALIPKIDAAAKAYPYAHPYTLWPGPNSNTFPAYIARRIPELGLALPADAIGKDYLVDSRFVAPAPSGTGYQISLFGVVGLLIAKQEGFEINILGGVYGVRFAPFRILLPGWG